MARKAAPKNDQTDVLMKSARRCALCFYLVGDLTESTASLLTSIKIIPTAQRLEERSNRWEGLR